MKNPTIIRTEASTDRSKIYSVHKESFGSESEAILVNQLRESASPFISLVAEIDNDIVGNIVFSPVRLNSVNTDKYLGLAPLAVLPKHQNKGVGSQLVLHGIKACEYYGADIVVVLGHSKYYS
jgi:putative acetyltransferase